MYLKIIYNLNLCVICSTLYTLVFPATPPSSAVLLPTLQEIPRLWVSGAALLQGPVGFVCRAWVAGAGARESVQAQINISDGQSSVKRTANHNNNIFCIWVGLTKEEFLVNDWQPRSKCGRKLHISRMNIGSIVLKIYIFCVK